MKSGRNRIYNAWTALAGGMLALASPARAFRYRHGRQMYRTYVAGELQDADRNFYPRHRSGDADVKRAYRIAVARCRDQAQNNPLISGAIERIVGNVVRGGIFPQFKFRTQDDKLDRLMNLRWKRLFSRWSLYCDSTGHHTYGGLQKLGLRHLWSDVGFLIHRTYDDSLPGIVPLRLELLECDQLDRMIDGKLANGNIARKGIEYNSRGREVAYHILDQHPGDYLNLGLRLTSSRIPAEDIIHVWDRRRISQFSGIPWMVAVVMEAYRMDEFRHTTQDAARTQASIVFFLQSAFPGLQLGGGMPLGGQATPYRAADTGTQKAPTEVKSNTVQPVPPGTQVNGFAPTHPGAQFEPFVKDSQRSQSAGIGMSFEAFSNNYTDASYSSARTGSLEERLSYRSQQQILEDRANRKVLAWFIESAYLAGLAPMAMSGYAIDPLRYHEMAEGMFPGWSWVDPNSDAKAAETKIRLTLDTHRNQAAQAGMDWDENVDQLIEEETKLLELEEVRAKRQQLQASNGLSQTN